MPCQSGETVEERNAATVKPYKDKLDQVTRLLCEMCHKVEHDDRSGFDYLCTNIEMSTWWRKHKELDEKRYKEEQRQAKIAELEQKLAELKKT